jgi:hypothetical protein
MLEGTLSQFLAPELKDAKTREKFFYTTGSQLPLGNFTPDGSFLYMMGSIMQQTMLLQKFEGRLKDIDIQAKQLRDMGIGQSTRGIMGITSSQLTEQRLRITEANASQGKSGIMGRLFGGGGK